MKLLQDISRQIGRIVNVLICGHRGIVSHTRVVLHHIKRNRRPDSLEYTSDSPPAILNLEVVTWYRHSLSVHSR